MRKLDYPLAPAVLAIVLGPLAETSMRQALLMSDGDLMVFLERPISGPIMGIAIVLFLLPLIKILRSRRRGGGLDSKGRNKILVAVTANAVRSLEPNIFLPGLSTSGLSQ
ncbi:MAG: hypothetical protein CM1200mP20_11500 [Pseudomonadota bacterium]|nr:MAG: hypothetical protein CM1200mP20_11500 [Pseudomonadota bacterium]